jgi:hypothetical protein
MIFQLSRAISNPAVGRAATGVGALGFGAVAADQLSKPNIRDGGDFNSQFEALNSQADIDNSRMIDTHKDVSAFDYHLAQQANRAKHQQNKELARMQSGAQMAQLQEGNRANAAANLINNSTQRSANMLSAVANASQQRWF